MSGNVLGVLLLLPLLTAALLALTPPSLLKLRPWISVVSSGALFAISVFALRQADQSGAITLHWSGWVPPYGIVFVMDMFSALMVVVACLIHLAGALYSLNEEPRVEGGHNFFHPLMHFMMFGVMGAFLTGDLFNLYVWYEVILLSSFVLLILGRSKEQLAGTLKYAVLNFLGSFCFLVGLGLLYGAAGTLNMAHLGIVYKGVPTPALAILFVFAFLLKAGAFPVYQWLPSSYHHSGFAISAVFAGLLTKVGVYSLFRLFGMVFTEDRLWMTYGFTWLAALTMLLGVLGAASQYHFRRILSFHIVSQIGYIMMGLALWSFAGLAGAVFYTVHHIVVKANLFFVSGLVAAHRGTEKLGALAQVRKLPSWLGLLFLVPAMSLAGLPPLSGFVAKLSVIQESFRQDKIWLASVALFVGLLTLFSMIKIWMEVFWRSEGGAKSDGDSKLGSPKVEDVGINRPVAGWRILTVVLLGLVTLWISARPDQLMRWSSAAAYGLMQPAAYQQAVLSGGM